MLPANSASQGDSLERPLLWCHQSQPLLHLLGQFVTHAYSRAGARRPRSSSRCPSTTCRPTGCDLLLLLLWRLRLLHVLLLLCLWDHLLLLLLLLWRHLLHVAKQSGFLVCLGSFGSSLDRSLVCNGRVAGWSSTRHGA